MTIERIARGPERRSYSLAQLPKIEKRSAEGIGTIVGYAAVYWRAGDPSTEFAIFDDLVERILPGAFDAAVREQDDAVGTSGHDFGNILGRVSNQTVRLVSDAIGLRYEIDLPDTQKGRDTKVSVDRGDLRGSSFGFTLWGKRGKYSYIEENRGGKRIEIRQIEDCELLDVGPVSRPAYDGTSVGVRSAADEFSREQIEAERQAWRQSLATPASDATFRAFVDVSAHVANRAT